MNISYNWLKQYIKFDRSPEQLSKDLTDCGLEVESIEPFESIKGGLKGLVVGEVLETRKHPNADRLTVCRVNTGTAEPSQIVCGAPNVAAGQKVIVATPGTTLFPLKGDAFQIKSSKIRGEASEGMICAEDEIGLGESHEGILVLPSESVPGTPVSDLFQIENDFTLSIGLTPNRPDAASHIGVARDLKAVLNTRSISSNTQLTEVMWPDVSGFKTPESAPVITAEVEDKACYRYSGVHIKNIKVSASPDWLQNRLKAIGLSPINNIVDITNFVLYELGQPLHAFDALKIHDRKIIVKRLEKDTPFVTLDGVERKLNGTEMMICDTRGGLCIAGVFGGSDSGVSESTTEVFLESAYFDSVSVRKTSKYHGLKTDASFRFERGTDPNMTILALKRAALLICEITGGEITSSVVDIYPEPVKDQELEFTFTNFQKLTGVELNQETFIKILQWLDITATPGDKGVLHLKIPAYRVDVTREADVIEEVLRIYGYDRIPLPEKMEISLPATGVESLEKVRNSIATLLTGNGFTEVMINSLYRSSVNDENESNAVRIKNPLSQELDNLRINMMYPLLDTVLYNRNRKRSNLRVFEFGKTYRIHESGIEEKNHLSLMLTGFRNEPHWQEKQTPYSVYYLKSLVNNIAKLINGSGRKLQWVADESGMLAQGIMLKNKKHTIALAGMVKKKILKKFDLDGEIWFVDIDLDNLVNLFSAEPGKKSAPPRFPEVHRDLSMLLDQSVQYQALENLAFETERTLLKGVSLFDVYDGDKIEAGKKSYALSFVLRDEEKTLTDKEIDKVMNRLMDAYEKKLGAVIRRG